MPKTKTPPLAVLFLIVVFTITGLIIFIPSQNKEPETDRTTNKPKVAATIYPVYDIVRGVAGDSLETILMLPLNSSPHTFDPSPSMLGKLKGVKAIFSIGYGLDQWANQMAEVQDLKPIILDYGIELIRAEEDSDEHEDLDEHEDDGHGHGSTDPHYWLDPNNIEIMANNAYQELIRHFPELTEELQKNLSTYKQNIELANTEAEVLLSSLDKKDIVVLHGAW